MVAEDVRVTQQRHKQFGAAGHNGAAAGAPRREHCRRRRAGRLAPPWQVEQHPVAAAAHDQLGRAALLQRAAEGIKFDE